MPETDSSCEVATRAHLAEEVAARTGLSKPESEALVRATLEAITAGIRAGERLEVRGFGTFRRHERAPRRGRNPKTGAPVDVPAKRFCAFKPGKVLLELVSG